MCVLVNGDPICTTWVKSCKDSGKIKNIQHLILNKQQCVDFIAFIIYDIRTGDPFGPVSVKFIWPWASGPPLMSDPEISMIFFFNEKNLGLQLAIILTVD